jgi:Chitin binding Peritrophin-A domain
MALTESLLGVVGIVSDVSCIGQPDGVFLGSRYCNVFHRCVSGTRRDFLCSRANNAAYHLWWNQQTQQCDWPCKLFLISSLLISSI